MNLEDRLRNDGRREHPNPLAARTEELIGRTSRLRQRRRAGVAGVAAAAVVAVGLLVPGPWRSAPLEVDPTTPISASPLGEPVSICDLTIDDLLEAPQGEQPLAPELPADVTGTVALSPSLDGEQVAVTVRLTNLGAQPITVRGTGNEVWAIDPATRAIAGYWADLSSSPDTPVPPGESVTLTQTFTFRPCDGAALPDGDYEIATRGVAVDGVGRDHWLLGGVEVTLQDGRVVDRDTPVGDPSAEIGEPFTLSVGRQPWTDWVWPDTGLAITATLVDPGPYSAAPDAPGTVRTTVTVTNTSDAAIRADVLPWLALLVDSGDDGRYPTSLVPLTEATPLDLAPGESVEIEGTLVLDQLLPEHRSPGEPLLQDGQYQVAVVLLDATGSVVADGAAERLLAWAVVDPVAITVESSVTGATS